MKKLFVLAIWLCLIACSILKPINPPSPTLTPEPTPTPTPISCLDAVAHFTEQAPPLLQEWQEAYDAAKNAPLVELPKKVQELQRIKREFEALLPAGCKEEAAALYQDSIQLMDEVIKGLDDLASGDLMPEAQKYLDTAEGYLKDFMDSLGMPQSEP